MTTTEPKKLLQQIKLMKKSYARQQKICVQRAAALARLGNFHEAIQQLMAASSHRSNSEALSHVDFIIRKGSFR